MANNYNQLIVNPVQPVVVCISEAKITVIVHHVNPAAITPSVITPIVAEITASSYSYPLAGKWLLGWELESTAVSSPRAGTTPGGNELGQIENLAAGQEWIGQGNMVGTTRPQTIHFSNLGGTTNVKIWLI